MDERRAHAFQVVAGWHQRREHLRYQKVSDVAVAPDDTVFLLTRQPGSVVVLSPAGELLRSWGEDELSAEPHGIAVEDERVYCTDSSSHVICVYTTSGERIDVIGEFGVPSDSGVDGSLTEAFLRAASIRRGAPPFNRPTNVAVADDGSLYVSDGYGNSRVHHFSAQHELMASWGEPGPRPGQFWVVHHVSVTQDGQVLVCDRENERVQVLDLGGRPVGQWEAQRPAAAVPAGDGLVWVSELAWEKEAGSFRQGRVQVRSPARVSLRRMDGGVIGLLGDGDGGAGTVQFRSPHGLAVGPNGDVYVADVAVGPDAGAGLSMVYKFERREPGD
jgi:sugar lactone lactonase YvrE